MPMMLDGSCHCRAVRFAVASHTPYPYQRCYRSICRKTGGGDGHCETSSGQRHSCGRCAAALWLADPQWPDLVQPLASAIDTDLPVPPAKVHRMLGSKASWVVPDIGPEDARFDAYPDLSIEDWHRRQGLWID